MSHDPKESDQVPRAINGQDSNDESSLDEASENQSVTHVEELQSEPNTPEDAKPGRGQNLVLIGLMGSGKSTVGRLLARLSGYGFIDLDEQVEKRQGRRVYDIFRDRGEGAFRAAELEALSALSGIRSHVIATGGGTVAGDECWQKLHELGHIIWLDTLVDVIAARLVANSEAISNRPLLDGLANLGDQRALLEEVSQRLNVLRQSRYHRYSAADFTVGEGYSTPDTTARLVLDLLSKSDLITPGTVRRAIDRWQNL